MNVTQIKLLTEEEIKKLNIVYMYNLLTEQQKWLVQNLNCTSNVQSPVFNTFSYSSEYKLENLIHDIKITKYVDGRDQ